MTPHLPAWALALLLAAPAAAQPPPEAMIRPADAGAVERCKALGAGWQVVDTDHFRVFSDTSPRYHRLIAGTLEQFYQEVHPRFFTRPMPRLDVYVVDGGRDYERFMTARGLGEYASAYGVFIEKPRGFYARRRFPDGRLSGVGTLFHEAIHAMIDAEVSGGQVPAWLNEGFAALFEQGRVVSGKWVYGNPNPWREKLFRPEFEAGRVPALADYFAMSAERFREPSRERTHYNVGRSLCLYLLTQRGEPVLKAFLRAALAGRTGKEALEAATGTPIAAVEAAWRENIRRVNFGGDYVARGEGPDAVRILEEGAKKHPGYGMLRLSLAEEYAAANRVGPALREAQAALADPRLIEPQRAHRVLALAYWDSRPREAAAALERVVAQQPWVEAIDETSFKDLVTLKTNLKDRAGAQAVSRQLAKLKQADARPEPGARP